MKNRFNQLIRLLVVISLLLSSTALISGASAQGSGISLAFAAADPDTYDHSIGGGQWNSGRRNIDIRETLEGEDFRCNEVVSYLMRVAAPDTEALRSLGLMTLDMNFSITMDTTGQSGVALGDPVSVGINISDPANVENGNSTTSTINSTEVGAMFTKGALLLKTFRLTGVEAGEVVVFRFNVKIHCQTGARPTGNLQVKFLEGALATLALAPGGSSTPINGGNETVSLKNVEALVVPSIALSKTVTTSTGSCPGQENIAVESDESVKYCYVVTNNSDQGGAIGAPLFNISTIADDNGDYPGFEVALASGLTDIDTDGQVDDLAIGASASGSYITSFAATQDVTVVNTATVSGFDQSNAGTQVSASDTASISIDAPNPAITVAKTTNGTDGATLLVGTAITWSYQVTNTGDRALSNVYVVDNQGVTVVCPKTTLAITESMTCSGTGSAVAGNYANTGTAYGTWNSIQVSAIDVSSYFGADPRVSIQKSPETQTVIEGQQAIFSITVSNTGNVPLTGVVVSDPLSSDCDKTIGGLAAGAQQIYTCSSPVITANLTNVASVVGLYGATQVTDSDSADVTVDFLPNIEVTKSASPTSVAETGGPVTFTFSIKNKAPEAFTLTSLVDDIYGNLNGSGTCAVPQTIAAGATYNCTLIKTLASDDLVTHVNLLTATGRDPEGNPGSGSDDATVTFVDVLPSVTVTKTASPSVMPESGGNVTFTFVVRNDSLEPFYLSSILDDKFGDLNGKGTCLAPQTIIGLGTYSCVYTTFLGDWTLNPFDNTVTVAGADNEGNRASDSDSFRVTFTDVLPQLSLTKTVDPIFIRSTGDFVNYTFTISNPGLEMVQVTSLTDPKIALSPTCLALVGQSIPAGGSIQCVTNIYMVIGPGMSFVNTATAIAKDNENNQVTATATATLKSYWFGRSPGYWKNHPEDWNSGYTPTMNIQDVFSVPSSLLSGGILDLDRNNVKDTLLAGLSYKGGAGITGAAQILLRASVAALLNEAYYGADFPAAVTVNALITRVNTVLATQNRSSYLALAGEYDRWNNGVEGPLP